MEEYLRRKVTIEAFESSDFFDSEKKYCNLSISDVKYALHH